MTGIVASGAGDRNAIRVLARPFALPGSDRAPDPRRAVIPACRRILRAWLGAAVLALAACGGADDDAQAELVEVDAGSIDPAYYAGDVIFRHSQTVNLYDTDLPFTFFAGLSPKSETRMDVNAFVDLRELQQRLPQLASRTITASCGVDLDVDLDQAFADGDQVRATGTVRARLYRCKNKGTEDESRGMRLLSPRIGVDATATAVIEGKCVKFNLTDIELDPQGAIGGIADVFGLTERVRTAILEKSRSYLAENPVCPRLPENLAVLNPEYVDGGPREIGEHGMGVALSGSVDTSAGTLLTLLELVKKRGIVGGVR